MKTTTPGTSSTPLLARLARGDDETATAREPGTQQPADGTDAGPLKQLASPPPQRQRSRREQPNPRHVPGNASLPSVSDAMAEIRLQIDLESAATRSDRSDRAWATRSEAATSSFHSAVDSPSRLQASPSPSRAGHGCAEQAPASHQGYADRIRDHLSRYEATPDAPDAPETQAHLEQEYIDWAAERQLQRHAAFGPNGGYQFNVDMHATGTDASLPVAYETLKGFLTSALRVPPGSAAAVQFDKQFGELTSKLGPTVAGGAVSGLGSGFIEQILLSAIDRRARLANMPEFKPVPPTVLSPAPGPVQMEITPQGHKHFWRPLRDHQVSRVGANGDHPTLDALQGVAHDRQRQLLQRQKLMEGKAEATFLRPLLTGTFNGIRRRLSSVGTLLSPTKLLGTSVLSAGGAGALTRVILETGKALPRTGQTQIDNLVGGRQTVNLFRLARLDESKDALRWSDARRLPNTLLDIAREAGALAAQPLTSPRMAMQVARDLLLRHIGGNIFTGWVATGGGTLLASVVRGGYGTPASGEAPSSAGSVVQQYGQSFSNDTVWNSLKSALGDTRQDLAASLDRRRDDKQASLWSKALAMQNRLRLQIKAVRQAADGAQDPRLQDAIGALAQSLEQGAGMIEHSDLDAALDAIERVLGEPGRTDSATLEQLRTLKGGVGELRALLVQRQALLDWRGGRQHARA